MCHLLYNSCCHYQKRGNGTGSHSHLPQLIPDNKIYTQAYIKIKETAMEFIGSKL